MTRMELHPEETGLPVTSVLVALDGSRFAQRALAPAGRIADRLGIPLQLVSGSPVVALTVADEAPTYPLVCLATHGLDRSAALLHSRAATLVAASHDPVLLVGPAVPDDPPAAGRLVACVDGTPESERIMVAAVSWAGALGLAVTAVTVAEPVPESLHRPGFYPRLHGPDSDADAYMSSLAAAWTAEVPVTGRAIYDPVDVDGALVDALVAEPPDLVVMGTRAPRGLRRLIFGSTASAVSHGSPAPVLVIPL